MKVLIADRFESTSVESLKSLGCDVEVRSELASDDLPQALAELRPNVLIVRSTRVTAKSLAATDRLALVVRAGSGTESIDIAEASRRGIFVANTPGRNATAVAELVHRLLTKDKRLRPNMSDAADDLGRLLSKLSGSGPVVRSHAPSSTDPDSTRVLRSASPSTTLGNSIGQHQGTTRRQKVLLIGGSMLAVLGAGVIAWRTSATAPTKPAVAAPVNPSLPQNPLSAPASVTKVKWTIASEPSGAAVFSEDGTMLGNTPWKAEFDAKPGTRQLRLRREGYAEASLDLDESSDSQLTVRLTRQSTGKTVTTKPRPAPVNPQPTPPKPGKRTGLSYED